MGKDPEFDKIYYKIRDVSEILGISASTLRYWESEFPELKPRRSKTNQRYYKPEDIRTLRIIHYLVKVKGLRIEAAREELERNRKNISKRMDAIELLKKTREDLKGILNALNKRK